MKKPQFGIYLKSISTHLAKFRVALGVMFFFCFISTDESLTCPSYCKATQCAPTACTQQCCSRYGQQAAAGGYGGQSLGQQYGYSYGNQVPLPQQPLQPFPMPSFTNMQCRRPPCPPQFQSIAAPCPRPPCPPQVPSLAPPCPRPPCPPQVPGLAAPCQRPPCPPQLPGLAAPCQSPPCPPQTPILPASLPLSTGTCTQPPCPPQPPLFQSSPLPCPQPPCQPPAQYSASSCPSPPCPPSFPNPATSCSQPPCPPPSPSQFSSLPCSTPPCVPNQGFQYNAENAITTQPLGRTSQLPSLALPARRHRLKEKKGKGKKGSNVVQDNQSQPKLTQQNAPASQELNYKDIFMPSSYDPYNQQSGYMVRMFKPVIEIQRPAPPAYGYGNGYQNYQYMYPPAQSYQPYSSYQPYQRYPYSQPYPSYQIGQPYQTFAPQVNIPAVSRATTAAGILADGKTATETKPDKQKHHRFHHRRRMPLTRYYSPSFQNQYYSNPSPFQGQLFGMYPPRQQYGSYMNYPSPIQFQPQPQFTYRYPAQPPYASQYQAPIHATFTPRKPTEVGGSPGLGYLELPSQARVCTAPCPNSCSPECTPDCCRDKKKKRQLITKP